LLTYAVQKNGCWQLAASIKFCITARSAQRTERDRNDIKHHRLKKKQDERMETTRKHIHGFGTTSFNLNTVTNKYACDKCKLEFQKTKRHLPEHCAKQQGIINAGKRPKVTDSREHSLKRQHIDRNKLDTTTTTTTTTTNNTNTNTTNNNLSNRHDGNREEDLAAAKNITARRITITIMTVIMMKKWKQQQQQQQQQQVTKTKLIYHIQKKKKKKKKK
jgi:hypothetical protein